MEFRKFEITLLSADNLPNVRSVFDMKVYGKVSIGGVQSTEMTTSVDTEGKTNPRWKYKMVYSVDESIVHNENALLCIKLYCRRTLKPDKYVGEVNLRLKNLFDRKSAEKITYNVYRSDSEGTFGTLDISYAFGEKFLVEKEKNSAWKVALEIAGLVVVEAASLGIEFLVQALISG